MKHSRRLFLWLAATSLAAPVTALAKPSKPVWYVGVDYGYDPRTVGHRDAALGLLNLGPEVANSELYDRLRSLRRICGPAPHPNTVMGRFHKASYALASRLWDREQLWIHFQEVDDLNGELPPPMGQLLTELSTPQSM